MTDLPVEKRERPAEEEGAKGDEPPAKVQKVLFAEIEEKLVEIQKEVHGLDEQCREEQIILQCSYDAKKGKHFRDRGECFKKIPEFWKTVICNFAAPLGLMLDCEIDALTYLEDVFLADNMDKEGSHKFTFTFKENPYFKETEIVKEIKVLKADPDNCEVKVTPITWTKDLLKDVSEAEKESSFFNWLQSNVEEREDFGNLFREKVWQDALMVFENEDAFQQGMDFDSEDDEDFENESDEECNDDEEDEECPEDEAEEDEEGEKEDPAEKWNAHGDVV